VTAPDAELAELLSALRAAAGDSDALEAAWPGIARTVGRLKHILSKTAGKSSRRRMRGHYDERDGSWEVGRVETRFPRPDGWYAFYRELLPVLDGPAFSDPRAADRRQYLLDFAAKIVADRSPTT
jgi:hypothetical protein